MKIFIKNCNICTDKDDIYISGKKEEEIKAIMATEAINKAFSNPSKKKNVEAPFTDSLERVNNVFTLKGFLELPNMVRTGDIVRLPTISIAMSSIEHKSGRTGSVLSFQGKRFTDSAIVVNVEPDRFDMLFDHILFESPIDLDISSSWKDSQLAHYLHGPVLEALQEAGIPAADCSILAESDVTGPYKFSYFDDFRNLAAYHLPAKNNRIAQSWWLRNDNVYTISRAHPYINGNKLSEGKSIPEEFFGIRPCFRILRNS